MQGAGGEGKIVLEAKEEMRVPPADNGRKAILEALDEMAFVVSEGVVVL